MVDSKNFIPLPRKSLAKVITEEEANTNTNTNTHTQQIHMVCCDTKLNIDQLFRKSLCPNCNTQLKYIIEPNYLPLEDTPTTPRKTNEIEEISHDINKNYMEIILPIYIVFGSILISTILYIHSNV